MSQIQIRQAQIEDLTSVVDLFEGYRKYYRKEPDPIAAEAFLKERIEKKESVIFIASANGIVCGFTQLYPVFSSTRMKRLWLLNDLFVHQNYRGKGISVALIDAAKKLCRETGACALTLETEKSNMIGNKLYPKTGFVLDTEHNFYEFTV